MPLTPRDFRRALRRASTPAERRLWSIVRDGRLDRLKIRRQHTIGPYVVDFFCEVARLAIELDGSVHEKPARAEYDAERERWLIGQGVRVLRFPNRDVMEQPEMVAAIMEVARSV